MIESSRFNNRLAWFSGNSDSGDYYAEKTGRYLGSWSRDQGNFIDDSKTDTILFDLEAWEDHNKKPPSSIGRIVRQIFPSNPDPFARPGKYIAIVGDSFCGAIDREQNIDFQFSPVRVLFSGPTWPSLVADGMKLNLAPYGFGGRSWWYSWQKFWQDWQGRLRDLEAVIFCHSHWDRINNAITDDLPHITHASILKDSTPDQIQAIKYHYAYLYDPDFQKWSQRQFFRHIRDSLPSIKMVHFFCFNRPSAETCSTLPGVIFNTPLMSLSLAETGTLNWPPNDVDPRANHLNSKNNQAIARLALSALNELSDGYHDLPYRDFDLKDPALVNQYIQNHADVI